MFVFILQTTIENDITGQLNIRIQCIAAAHLRMPNQNG
jgi:hypothetical protein